MYDLKRDPRELNNVYEHPDYADVWEDLKNRLEERKQSLDDGDDQYPDLVELKEEYW